MKKLRGSLWAKELAIALLCLLAVGCAASTLAAGWLYEEGAYTDGYDAAARRLLGSLGQEYANNVGMNWLTGDRTELYEDGGFRYAILDPGGKATRAADGTYDASNGNVKCVRMHCRTTGQATQARMTQDAELGYTSMAQRIKNGEVELSNTKGVYLVGGSGNSGNNSGWGDEPVVNP